MRPRAQAYRTLDGLSAEREAISWYWKMVAVLSSILILGGFLMLPATFERGTAIRTTQAVVGIFAVALLTAGFSLTGLICFAVRNPLFRADSVFLPAIASCALGLLTVFYDFLVFDRYEWNTPAILTAVAAAISTTIYTGLLLYNQWKLTKVKSNHPNTTASMPMNQPRSDSDSTLWQERGYYENYTRNMWPTAYPASRPAQADTQSITEEEMQRQQMLMLLLQREQPDAAEPSSSTFHIDWQGREEEDAPPTGGYYAPESAYPNTAYSGPSPGIMRQWSNELQQNLRPWDGVWRTPARVHSSPFQQQVNVRDERSARRHEIEQGRY